MKKFISLLLVVAMCLSLISTTAFATNTEGVEEITNNTFASTTIDTNNTDLNIAQLGDNAFVVKIPASLVTESETAPWYAFDITSDKTTELSATLYRVSHFDAAEVGTLLAYLAQDSSPEYAKNIAFSSSKTGIVHSGLPGGTLKGHSGKIVDYQDHDFYIIFVLDDASKLTEDTTVTVTGMTEKWEFVEEQPEESACIVYDDGDGEWCIAKDRTEAFTFSHKFEAPKAPVAQIGEGEGAQEFTSLQAAVNAAQSGDIIKLLSDASGNGVDVAGDKNVTFDFDGHTYTLQGEMVGSSGTKTNGFRFLDGSTVTLKNGKLANGATTAEGNTPAKVMVNSYANLTLENFSIDGTTEAVAPSGSAYGTAALYINNKNTVVKGNGTYTGDPDGYVIYMANVEYYSDDAVLTFDKTFTGTVSGKVTNGNKQDYSIAVENGKFAFGEINLGEGAMKLIGGVYTTNVSAYVATGYACVDNTDYSTKAAYPYAVKPVQVEMPKDVTVEGDKVKVGEEEIDLTLTKGEDAETEPTAEQAKTEIAKILDNKNVTSFADTKIDEATPATNKTTVEVGGQNFDLSKVLNALKTEAETNHTSLTTTVTQSDKLTVDSSDFTDTDVSKAISIDLTAAAVTTTTDDESQTVVSLSTTTFEVKPIATITVTKAGGGIETIKAVIPNEAITAPITFRLPVPADWTGDVKVYHEGALHSTCRIKGSDNNKYVELASDTFSSWTIEQVTQADIDSAVAKTDEKYYDSLVEALKDVTDGGTVTVLKPCVLGETVTVNGKDFTLDLGSNLVMVTADYGLVVEHGKVTVKNGTISDTGTKNNGATFKIVGAATDQGADYAKVTLDNVDLFVDAHYAASIVNASNTMHGYGAALEVKGNSELEAPYVISVSGNIQDTTGNFPKVTLNGAKITATTDDAAIYAAGYAKWVINNNSTIIGGTGIYAKAGNFDVDGGTITANGSYHDPVAQTGCTSTGDGIILDTNASYAGKMELDLNDVTVSSENGYAVQEAITNKDISETRSIKLTKGTLTGAKGAIATSDTFNRSENATLTIAAGGDRPTVGGTEGDYLAIGKFTSFNVNYGDGFAKDAFDVFTDEIDNNDDISATPIQFATMSDNQKLIANFSVSLGTVSYAVGTVEDDTEFTTIHSGEAFEGVVNGSPITLRIECGNGYTHDYKFTPKWENANVDYTLFVKPIDGETVNPTNAGSPVVYGVYVSGGGESATPVGSYNFELMYNSNAFEFASYTAADVGQSGNVECAPTSDNTVKIAATVNGDDGNGITPTGEGALLGTLTLTVKDNSEATITTGFNHSGTGTDKPVVTPKGFDKNDGDIAFSGHTQNLITFAYNAGVANGTEQKVWFASTQEPTLANYTPDAFNTGWTTGKWDATAELATAPKTYTYNATHIQYKVTWTKEGDDATPMQVLKSGTYVDGEQALTGSGDNSWMYYEDTLRIVPEISTEGQEVVRVDGLKYTLGTAMATSDGISYLGERQFKLDEKKVTANVKLSYTTSEYVEVTFNGGNATLERENDLIAYTLKSNADALYASIDDFIKGNDGTKFDIPKQIPKTNESRLVPPDALDNVDKQQWREGSNEPTDDPVTNYVLNGGENKATYSKTFTANTTLYADAVKIYKVTFEAGTNGTIKNGETTEYYVDEGTSIADIIAGSAKYNTEGSELVVKVPDVVPTDGYKLKEWTPSATGTLTGETTITASFEKAKYTFTQTGAADIISITGTENSSGTKLVSMDNDVVFTLKARGGKKITKVTYSVTGGENGTTFTAIASSELTAQDGKYTIPKENIKGNVSVAVETTDTVTITVFPGANGFVKGQFQFTFDKDAAVGTNWYDGLQTKPNTGYVAETKTVTVGSGDDAYDVEVLKFYTDAGCETAFTATTFDATQTLYVKFVPASYKFNFTDGEITTGDGITAVLEQDGVTVDHYNVTYKDDAVFTLGGSLGNEVISSVTYKVGSGAATELKPNATGQYTIPGERITGEVTVKVNTLASEIDATFAPIKALFIFRSSDDVDTKCEAGEFEGSGAYMSVVNDNTGMKILALVSDSFSSGSGEGAFNPTAHFFQLANGTQLYWSNRYNAYVCWVPATMTSADLNGYVKHEQVSGKTVTIVNGGDINFDSAVDSADAGIVNDTLHGKRLVPTSALQLFEMDVANTNETATGVNDVKLDANDVTWILKKTVNADSVEKAYNQLSVQNVLN